MWELSPRKGKKAIGFFFFFLKPSCSSLQLHFSKHAQMLLSPAGLLHRLSQSERKGTESRRSWKGLTARMLCLPVVPPPFGLGDVSSYRLRPRLEPHLTFRRKKVNRDTQNALFIKEHGLNPVILTPVPEQSFSSLIPVLCPCSFHSSVLL